MKSYDNGDLLTGSDGNTLAGSTFADSREIRINSAGSRDSLKDLLFSI